MSRKYHIIGNWKMNKTASDAVNMAEDLVAGLEPQKDVVIGICPPFTALSALSKLLEENSHFNIELGAQNMHYEPKGPFTGEVSLPMLKEFYVTYVILGHSERRHIFGESDEFINKKVLAALEGNLKPILCVGETEDEREAGKTMEVVRGQIEAGLEGVELDQMDRVLVAYEPVWAIGTGKNATPAEAQEVHAMIRKLIEKKYDNAVASKLIILYGGSMKAENAEGLLLQPDVDGGLIGGASLDSPSFRKLIKLARKLSAVEV